MAKALGHLMGSEAWRVCVTLAVLAVSAGITFGMFYLPCHQDFCLYDSDPDARWVVQIALIVYYCVLFAYAVFAWGEARFLKRRRRFLGLSLPQWAFGVCTLALFLFGWGYWAGQFYEILNSNPFYGGWMSDNWVRRPAYFATQVTGGVVAIVLGLAVLTSSKNSCNSLFLPHDEALPFHRWTSWLFVLVSVVHIAVYFYSAAVDEMQTWASHVFNSYEAQYAAMFAPPTTYLDWGVGNWTAPLGTYGTLVLIIPTVFCIPFLRRHVYNWFYFTHWMMMAGFIVLCLHATMDFYFSLPGLCLLAFDWAMRLWVRYTPLDIVRVDCDQPNDMVRVDFDVSRRPDLVSFRGGQFVRVCLPSTRPLEWHPLSLAAQTGDSTWALLVDSRNGDWKRLLATKLATTPTTTLPSNESKPADTARPSKVIVEGPYGSVPFNTEALEKVLCLAGGSGITPCLSLARENPGKAAIVWSMRSSRTDVSADVSGELFRGVSIQVYQTTSHILDSQEKPASEFEKASSKVQPGQDLEEAGMPFMGAEDSTVAAGRIPFAKILEEHLGKVQSCGVYICGPHQFRRVAEAHVKAFSLSNEGLAVNVYVESYFY